MRIDVFIKDLYYVRDHCRNYCTTTNHFTQYWDTKCLYMMLNFICIILYKYTFGFYSLCLYSAKIIHVIDVKFPIDRYPHAS